MGWISIWIQLCHQLLSGKKNDKADALIKKSNERPTEDKYKQRQYQICVLILSNRIDCEAELQPIEKSNEDHANWANPNASEETSTLPEQVMKFNQNNKLCSKICLYFANPKGLDKSEVYLKSLKVENGLLMKENWLWITNKSQLQLEVIKKVYDQPAVGHSGTKKTLEMVWQHYYWPGIKEIIQWFICNCHMSKQAKTARDIYHDLLQPLPMPEQV